MSRAVHIEFAVRIARAEGNAVRCARQPGRAGDAMTTSRPILEVISHG